MPRISGTARVVAASALVGVGLVGVGWLDYRATRSELLALLQDQAQSLRETIAAAARSNQAAGALAEAQLDGRLRDNLYLLAEIDRRGALDQRVVDDVVSRNRLFHVTVVGPDGTREMSSGSAGGPGPAAETAPAGAVAGGSPPAGGSARGPRGGPGTGGGLGPGPGGGLGPGGGQGPGRGPGRGLNALVDQALKSGDPEGVLGLHASRWGTGARLARYVRRARGGVIVANVDATEVANLRRQASLEALLDDILTSARDVAYLSLQIGEVRIVRGDLPSEPDPAAGAPLGPAGTVVAGQELSVSGRPVLEFRGPIDASGGEAGLLRLGLRLDAVRATERRLLWRVSLSLVATTALALLALGTIWLRRELATVSEKHARAEAALRRRDRLAAMGELASTVAHEVRNPLNAIAMSAQRLRREFLASLPDQSADRQELGELVGIVEGESRRIDAIVQEFLKFARPPKLEPRRGPLGEFVAGVVEATRALAESRGVTLAAEVSGAADAVFDAGQLRQALDNLVRNAIEATPEGGSVVVTARSSSREHTIEVADTGHGIDAEHLPKVFDLYFTTKSEGTGIGLAVTQQIVTAHGGTIEVDSKVGAGTRMFVRLPCRIGEASGG